MELYRDLNMDVSDNLRPNIFSFLRIFPYIINMSFLYSLIIFLFFKKIVMRAVKISFHSVLCQRDEAGLPRSFSRTRYLYAHEKLPGKSVPKLEVKQAMTETMRRDCQELQDTPTKCPVTCHKFLFLGRLKVFYMLQTKFSGISYRSSSLSIQDSSSYNLSIVRNRQCSLGAKFNVCRNRNRKTRKMKE